MKRRKQLRLARKMVLAFVLVLLIPASVIALYAYQRSAEHLLEQSRLEGLRIASERANRVEALIQEMTADLLFLSQLPPVQNYVQSHNQRGRVDELSAIEHIYAAFLQRSLERYQRACLLHETGVEIACAENHNGTVRIIPAAELRDRSQDLIYRGALTLRNQNVRRPIYVTNSSFAAAGGAAVPVLCFALALQGEHALPAGVVVLEASAEPVVEILAGDLEHWQVSLIDRSGTYELPLNGITGVGSVPAASKGYWLQTASAPHPPDDAVGALIVPPEQPDQTLAYARIAPAGQEILDWTVVYTQPHAVILGDVQAAGQVTLLITLLSLLVAMLVALLLTRSIVAPISELALAVEQVGAGQLDTHIPVRTNDEVGALARAFNQMTGRLQETLQHLQQRVAELQEARDTQQRLAAIIEATPDLVAVAEVSGRLIYLNQAGRAKFGLAADADLAEVSLAAILVPEMRPILANDIIPMTLAEGVWSGEITFLRSDQSVAPASLVVVAHHSPGERVLLAAILRDLSASRQTEAALQNSETMLCHVIDSISDHIYTTEFEIGGGGRNVYLSPNFADLTGYDVERILNDWYCWGKELIHPDDHPAALQHLRRLKSGRNSEIEYRIIRADGEIVWVRDSARVKQDARRITIYGVISDITARRRLEEQLLQAQKMEAVGRLAGGIAHDFNNILTYIIASCDLLMIDLGADDPVAQEIAQIQEAGQRAVGLTSQLLAFSRRQIMQPRLLDLNEVVVGVEKLLRRLIGEDINLQTYLARSLPLIHVDPVQLEQVIINLAVNGRDAMPAGGRLTIATSTRQFQAEARARDTEIAPGTYVLLAISDTGHGISEQVLPHIFEPFFTTKSGSQGSGLGLATVHGIVRQSGGHILVHSREQVGTTFMIYLPVAVVGEQHQETIPPPVHDLQGDETILLVEDDDQLRNLVSRVLDRYGYRVIEAGNGVQAQEIADVLGDAIDVLITDIVMGGGINGIQLAQKLAEEHDQLSIICMSGYTEYSLSALHQIDAPVMFLQKPFAPRTLVYNLRGLLESPRHANGQM